MGRLHLPTSHAKHHGEDSLQVRGEFGEGPGSHTGSRVLSGTTLSGTRWVWNREASALYYSSANRMLDPYFIEY